MWTLRWQGVVDLLVVSMAVYFLLTWAREARALRIALGIVALRAASFGARQLDLVLTTSVLDAAAFIAVVLLLVVFQPELRRILLHLDLRLSRPSPQGDVTPALLSSCDAAFSLAATGRGALIVLQRRDDVESLVSGGIPLGGTVSREILEAIFRKVSPVHDGATIISADRILRVATILPLSDNPDLPSEFGTRHRAAFGLAERCDAAVVVVSEERGAVSLVQHSHHWTLPTVEDLAQHLRGLGTAPRSAIPSWYRRNIGMKVAAAAMALLIWLVALGPSGTAVRNVMVPIEFTNVPSGMAVKLPSDRVMLQVQLRASSWLFDAVSLNRLAARVDLRGSPTGRLKLRIHPGQFQPPPGIRVEHVDPDSVEVDLVGH